MYKKIFRLTDYLSTFSSDIQNNFKELLLEVNLS